MDWAQPFIYLCFINILQCKAGPESHDSVLHRRGEGEGAR
uniref:Uncharacterized protein n=1 Tax=Anguilla anguilla TaxID=7936 RepID=A0A0E9TWW5_ANGAN